MYRILTQEKKQKTLFLMFILMVCSLCMPAMAVSYDKYVKDIRIDDATHTITVYMDDSFSEQDFTDKSVRKIYRKTTKEVHKALPKQYTNYDVRIITRGVTIENLITKEPRKEEERSKSKKKRKHGWWGKVSYDGRPWVTNISLPHTISNGLQGRHISLWASHGRFYDGNKGKWRWQRPNMFCTNEDLFTQTIVVPYLIPMLERAGANVFTPRERDWQTEEVIVDNDDNTQYYKETTHSGRWKTAATAGFAMPIGTITDGYNPFEKGTVRQISTTKEANASSVSYQPIFPKTGRYAVYVSYATLENSVDDALYIVHHQGQRTEYRVNQQMGGNTWVYLGTFEFDAGCSPYNRVEVSAQSSSKGVVTTDAVRFGGGMGNIERGGSVSGMPRCLEGARYYAQWAGVPYSLYSLYQGEDDYKDDINSRSLMTNWLAGGSPYAPNKEGKNVPIDLCLAIHSDAGFDKDMESIYGSLAICTTDFNDGKLDAGAERTHSKELCQRLLEQTKKDIKAQYGNWTWRDLYDRNYSETRLPAMPSAIFETLSHQSFPDMRLGHDPDFKFTLARSIYKTILRYEAEAHGEKAVVSPLAPVNFYITLDKQGNAILAWSPQKDKEESSANATSYNVYMAMGGFDYDNGRNTGNTSYKQKLEPDLLYRFRITAVNAGGESFPTEELCVVWHGPEAKTVMIINGFQRLSGPAQINTLTEKGFDLYSDPGVSYGLTAGWSGTQQVFSTETAGKEGYGTFGYCGEELAGQFVAGNNFNYVAEHTLAILSSYKYNVVSATKSVAEWGGVTLTDYDVIDLILGNERYTDNTLHIYKTFTKQMQKQLLDYQKKGHGAILVSGSYIGSDMQEVEEKSFLQRLLHTNHAGTIRYDNATVTGLQQTLAITNSLNPDHYATLLSDILQPTGTAFVAMQYRNLQTAAVAYQGATNTFAMGFPFECITNSAQRAVIMRGILDFLTK